MSDRGGREVRGERQRRERKEGEKGGRERKERKEGEKGGCCMEETFLRTSKRDLVPQ